ncbi:MAG: RNA polymerase subunit sigma-70 [Actinobacteria bacterium 13_1_20CM_3_71_11]|nr:MAG: RNA polymerase subunit sigma-70 [Actinobacteria bacterium 13_1_20CM_3_71_11]
MTHAATATMDRALEEQIREHIPLVGHLVRETLGRVPGHVSRDDLTSAGLVALVTAAKAYDASHGVPFTRFVAIRIKGALVDALRGLDWATRSVRHRARQVEKVRQELTAALGRTPTNTELAQSLGVAVDELDAVEDDVRRAVVLSLQGFATGSAEDMVTERDAGPEDLLLHRERIGYLHNAIEALPERLKLVVTRYFLEERPMADVAAELGVTESRVSQLRSEALSLLKDGLNAHLNPAAVTVPSRPEGCVARRRTAYFAEIGNQGTLKSRLAMTTELGMPLRQTA